jgi:hypothetical protein
MIANRLELAPEKTEAVLLIGRKRCAPVKLELAGKEIRYLGIVFDRGLTFGRHVEKAVAKAHGSANSLLRILPRTGWPRESRRGILASVVDNIILYRSPVWAGCVKVQRHRKALRSAQRKIAIWVANGQSIQDGRYRGSAGAGNNDSGGNSSVAVGSPRRSWERSLNNKGDKRGGKEKDHWKMAEAGEPGKTESGRTAFAGKKTRRALTGHGCFQSKMETCRRNNSGHNERK